jgi:hypothetical protein
LKIAGAEGAAIFEDKFEWDILNESNKYIGALHSIEEFVDGLIQDYDIPKKYFS